MALWVCGGEAGCGTKYAVGLFRCPRCHNAEFYEDGDPMAKITRHGGASDKTLPENAAAAETVPAPEAAADQPERDAEPLDVTEHMAGPVQPVEVRGEHGPGSVDLPHDTSVFPAAVDKEGGEESSPGSSSSASTEKPQPTSEPNSKPPQKRARKTASRSAKDQTENPSAPSTAGGRETDTSAADETAE